MQEKVCGIYCIENIVTRKKYIGCSVDIKTRTRKHRESLNRGEHHNIYLQRAWDKYGESCFIFGTIEECEKEILKEKEIYYISFYKTTEKEFGFNLTSGGDGVHDYKHTEESLKKIAEYSTGRKQTEEAKLKIAIAKIGNHFADGNTNMKGKKHSEETKKKISEINKGKPAPNKGIPASEESKRKMSESRKAKETNGSSSKYHGVIHQKSNKSKKKWFTRITVNGKRIHRGPFMTEIEAAKKYNEMALFYFGENAILNVIDEE